MFFFLPLPQFHSSTSENMSAYEHVSGGSLKFKGGTSSIKKKKKKSKSSKEKMTKAIESSQDDPKIVQVVQKTDAEKRFEEIKRKRQLDRASKQAQKSHKERVAEFNTKLDNLTEHFDLPKVGPG
ncbi:DUF1754-domain-containing protein [Hesseltinella vesiculosa]|uniref:DUF1754-domain-containing protein n=1 Tax=Hesseltinella vesiculosa TaxID=101127 RepID=A0A1X2GGJ0_9FUNG|nr:DUF1754-domain-containing protein [Hesseltinella vesiculosa]